MAPMLAHALLCLRPALPPIPSIPTLTGLHFALETLSGLVVSLWSLQVILEPLWLLCLCEGRPVPLCPVVISLACVRILCRWHEESLEPASRGWRDVLGPVLVRGGEPERWCAQAAQQVHLAVARHAALKGQTFAFRGAPELE